MQTEFINSTRARVPEILRRLEDMVVDVYFAKEFSC